MSGTCYTFQNTGNCRFGDSCRFNHEGGVSNNENGDNSMTENVDGNGRSSFRSPRSGGGGSGPCYSFQNNGSCKFGDSCRFNHGDGASSTGGASGFSSSRGRGGGRGGFGGGRGGGSAGGEGGSACYAFRDNGFCKFGDSCRFGHGGASGSSRPRSSNVCNQFKSSGNCSYGDSCRFVHDANADSAAPSTEESVPAAELAAE